MKTFLFIVFAAVVSAVYFLLLDIAFMRLQGLSLIPH